MPLSRRTLKAKRDLVEIWVYLATNAGVSTADAQVDKIEAEITFLTLNPLAGPARPDLRVRLRSWPVGNYVIFYRPLKGSIEVTRVMHGARNLPEAFRRRN